MGFNGNKTGFTLIELMIVVAVIAVLAAIAIPKFSDMLEKGREGATLNNLAALRSAVSVYYSEKEGKFPGDLTTSFTNYIYPIPPATASPLGNSNDIALTDSAPSSSGTGWAYVTDIKSAYPGIVFCNTTATDTKGISFTTY